MKKILFIFGTRPEAIKMAPVVMAAGRCKGFFRPMVCVTAQHRHMLDQFLELFKIKPDLDLDLMEKDQTLESFSQKALVAIAQALQRVKPALVIVQGDTTTAMIAALAAFYQKIPVGHVEAGLRTLDKYNPFPEEMNRQIIGRIAEYHFAPTARARQMLLKEGIAREHIYCTGNTVVDALGFIVQKVDAYPTKLAREIMALMGGTQRIILVTAHRRENFGRPLRAVCSAIKTIVREHKDVEIVYPVHLNPNVQRVVRNSLGHQPRVHLIEPVEYFDLIRLLRRCYLVLTDSGGIQEEAPTFGKPVLVLREETERPEGVEAGVAKLVGTDPALIVREVNSLLSNAKKYTRIAKAVNPYGDGTAAQHIIRVLRRMF